MAIIYVLNYLDVQFNEDLRKSFNNKRLQIVFTLTEL